MIIPNSSSLQVCGLAPTQGHCCLGKQGQPTTNQAVGPQVGPGSGDQTEKVTDETPQSISLGVDDDPCSQVHSDGLCLEPEWQLAHHCQQGSFAQGVASFFDIKAPLLNISLSAL